MPPEVLNEAWAGLALPDRKGTKRPRIDGSANFVHGLEHVVGLCLNRRGLMLQGKARPP